MATRRAFAERRQALVESIRQAIRSGELQPGDLLPSLRALGSQHQLSHTTVAHELRRLTHEGVLRSVPSVGFVVGHATSAADEYYLLVTPSAGSSNADYGTKPAAMAVHSFEQQITAYGGRTMTLPADQALSRARDKAFPDLAGVFCFLCPVEIVLACAEAIPVPLACYGTPMPPGAGTSQPVDHVAHDNRGGGIRATQQLLQRGHRRIAFAGLHHAVLEPRRYGWSRERQGGWQEAMTAAFPGDELVSFHPDVVDPPSEAESRGLELADVARDACRDRARYTGLVAADDQVVLAVAAALTSSGVPQAEWPELVGFESLVEAAPYSITSVRPSWYVVGHAVAELLWQRHTGQLTGPAVQRVVPMDLIARFPRVEMG